MIERRSEWIDDDRSALQSPLKQPRCPPNYGLYTVSMLVYFLDVRPSVAQVASSTVEMSRLPEVNIWRYASSNMRPLAH